MVPSDQGAGVEPAGTVRRHACRLSPSDRLRSPRVGSEVSTRSIHPLFRRSPCRLTLIQTLRAMRLALLSFSRSSHLPPLDTHQRAWIAFVLQPQFALIWPTELEDGGELCLPSSAYPCTRSRSSHRVGCFSQTAGGFSVEMVTLTASTFRPFAVRTLATSSAPR